MPNSQSIDVAICFDEGYVPYVYVLLTSLFQHHTDVRVTVHALAPRISATDQEAIRLFVAQQGGQICFYALDTSLMQGFALPDHATAYFTLANYYRLFFADLVTPELERLLYLDIDTLVVGSLKPLFQIDLSTFALGAVQDADMHVRLDLGITIKADYFNSGVLLINLPQWRQQRITERACDIAIRYPEKVKGWVDQDALNLLLQGHWYRLNGCYNVMNGAIPADLPRREHAQFLADKVVIHFTGTPKPWHWACDSKFRYLYQHYAHGLLQARVHRNSAKKLSSQQLLQLAKSRMLEIYFDYPEIGRFWRKLKSNVRK
jgi:lipopolysaccharide biosynthesis glycosyltransferase